MKKTLIIAEIVSILTLAAYLAYGLMTGNANSITYHL